MKTDFQASGTHFLSFSQTTVSCCQWKQFILQLEHIFQNKTVLNKTVQDKTVLFFSEFFLLLKLGGSQFLKTKYIPASEHQFFQYFQRF